MYRAAAFILLALAPVPGLAATREREELSRLELDIQRVDREIQSLKLKQAAAKPEDRPALDSELARRTREQGELTGRLGETILKAYKSEPKPDEKITQMALDTMLKDMSQDRWEEAARFGQALLDKGNPDKRIAELAGISAFNSNNFEAAEKHLTAAHKARALGPDGQRLLAMVPRYKQYWAAEQRIRQAEGKANDLPRVKLETTAGDIEIELFENQAPNTVANFVSLVESGFYNGTVFHRVIPGFMAQGGDPTGSGRGGPDWAIKCECYREDFRRHFRGTLSMAHAGRDTGGSQFFLTFVPTPHLDGKHTAFGRVVEGWNTLSNIVRRDPGSDTEPSKILRATVLRKRNYKYVPEKLPARR